MNMGNRIASARKRKGFTQEYVAESLGVSRQAVFKWEKGHTYPDTKKLIGLSKLLDVSVDSLIHGDQSQKGKQRKREFFFRASFLPLAVMPVCWLVGLFSGVYTDMVQLPIGNGIRIGIPFLMYGHSPLAVILVSVSVISFLLFLFLIFLGIQADQD